MKKGKQEEFSELGCASWKHLLRVVYTRVPKLREAVLEPA